MKVVRTKSTNSLNSNQRSLEDWHEPFAFTIPSSTIPSMSSNGTKGLAAQALDMPPSTTGTACACSQRVRAVTSNGRIEYTLRIRVFSKGVALATRVEEVLLSPTMNQKPPVDVIDFPHDYKTVGFVPRPFFAFKQKGRLTLTSAEPPPFLFTESRSDAQTVLQMSLVYSVENSNNLQVKPPPLTTCEIMFCLKATTIVSLWPLKRQPTSAEVASTPTLAETTTFYPFKTMNIDLPEWDVSDINSGRWLYNDIWKQADLLQVLDQRHISQILPVI
jgi:hypothetical protein